MNSRAAVAISSAALLAVAGTTFGQQGQSGGGSANSGSGSSATQSGGQSSAQSGSGGAQGTNAQPGTSAGGGLGNELNLPQNQQGRPANAGETQGSRPVLRDGQPVRGLTAQDDQLGTRSSGGVRSDLPSDLAGVGQNDPFSRTQDLNLPPVQDGRITTDFLRNLTPQQRFDLARQIEALGLENGGGVGNVQISSQRRERLLREQQMRQQRAGDDYELGMDFSAGQAARDRFGPTDLRRLDALEQSLIDQNDQLLQRLGQVRQLPQDRQLDELSGVIQELLLERAQTLEYIAQVRSVAVDQSLAAGYENRGYGRTYGSPEGGMNGRGGFVEPNAYSWENERQYRSQRRFPPRAPSQERFRPQGREFDDRESFEPRHREWYDNMFPR